jgi:hypothetical protein
MVSFVAPAANKSDVPAFTIADAVIEMKSGSRSGSIRVSASTWGCPRGPEALTEYDSIGCNPRH